MWSYNNLWVVEKWVGATSECRIGIFPTIDTWSRKIAWWSKLDLWLNWHGRTFALVGGGATIDSTPSGNPTVANDVSRWGKVSNLSSTC